MNLTPEISIAILIFSAVSSAHPIRHPLIQAAPQLVLKRPNNEPNQLGTRQAELVLL